MRPEPVGLLVIPTVDWSGGGYARANSYYAGITRKSGTKGCRFRDDGRVVV